MAALTLYELPPSPNSIKVRIGLGFKALEYEKRAVDLTDREPVIQLSTQPRTPVLQHGETVIFDSGAILRYLDANFPATPQLYSADYQEMGAIETWELYSRTDLGPPIGICFTECFKEAKDPAEIEQACAMLTAATRKIEDTLADGPWLLGERFTAADAVCVPFALYGMVPDAMVEGWEITRFFQENLHLGEGRERTRDWVRRALVHDR